MRIDCEEVTALRPGRRYVLESSEPKSGTWWAVKAIPVAFPGPHHPVTIDGEQVEKAAIVASYKGRDGMWRWCHLTLAAKLLFGDMLFEFVPAEARSEWHYVREEEVPPDAEA